MAGRHILTLDSHLDSDPYYHTDPDPFCNTDPDPGRQAYPNPTLSSWSLFDKLLSF